MKTRIIKTRIANIVRVLSLIAICSNSKSNAAHALALIKRIESGDPCHCAKTFVRAISKEEVDIMRHILRATDNEAI